MRDLEDQEVPQESSAVRLSALAQAMLGLGESLDFETVLRQVVQSARELTGARYGAIATIDGNGMLQDFVTSGFTEEEHRGLIKMPYGPKLFEFFRDLPGPIRISDVPAYVRSLGFPADFLPSTPFQGTPMRHRGKHVGNFYLAEKEGGRDFTDADEEVLVLFAAQAAAAIAHAGAYQEERRTRANLEALIETSPVGVVVFDAGTGAVVSLNIEARRIVKTLSMPDQNPEDLLQNINCRRADGHLIALAELPLATVHSNAETVRAEEIELSVPDGRSLTTLINATPIRDEQENLVSVVVTMQDLAPIRELERMRAGFLSMVSHELRAPLTSIKGSAATVLGSSRVFGPTEIEQFFRIIEEQADRMDSLISDLLDAGRIKTGILSVAPSPSDVMDLLDRARTTFLTGGGRHPIVIDTPPDLPRVMADRPRILQVLNNLLTNAARHSPESSPIRVHGTDEGVHVSIAVSDEGHGLAPDRLAELFRDHSGTVQGEHSYNGGLGLAICKGLIEAHGGRIQAESDGPGQGTRFTFTLPAAEGTADRNPPAPQTPNTKKPRILVVDDDPETLRLVRVTLDNAGYSPIVTSDHQKLDRLLFTQKPNLVLLDFMLQGIDGIELMARVPGLADLPVLFISGYGRDEIIARALEAGAEDYIVKPFSPTELIARIRAALRRRTQPETIAFGDLTIDYNRRRVTIAGNPIPLTPTEHELLRVLSLNAGQVTTYQTLLRQVWGRYSSTNREIVRAYVTRLRHKLGDNSQQPTYIHTQHRVGYRMPQPGQPVNRPTPLPEPPPNT